MAPSDVLVVGETLVDLLPETPGELRTVESFERRAGGAPANVAARLEALGADPLFWTRIGDDAFGDFLADTLDDRDVSMRFVQRDPTAKTSLAFVAHDDTRDRSFTFYRDGTADTKLERGTVPTSELEALEWLYVGGVALASEPARSAVLDLLHRAREESCSVYFDPNWRPELWDATDTDVLREAIELSDVVKASNGELERIGYPQPSLRNRCEAVCQDGPHSVFLTRGSDGAVAYSTDDAPFGSGRHEHVGFEVEPVDTTGAGDAFVAATIAGLTRGWTEVDRILELGNASAALATTTTGAMEQPPDWAAIEAFAAAPETHR